MHNSTTTSGSAWNQSHASGTGSGTANQPRPAATHPSGGPSPAEAAMQFINEYSRERPEVVALWAFGIGFILGWRLKPW